MDKHLAEELEIYPTSTLERLIGRYQNIQKMHGPDSLFGQDASRELQPLFAEMARRQKAGLLTRCSSASPRYMIDPYGDGTFRVIDNHSTIPGRVVYDRAPTLARAEMAARDLPR